MITSLRNPHVLALRALLRPRERARQGRLVVTGLRLIDAALRYGAHVEEVLVVPGVSGLGGLRDRAAAAGAAVVSVSERVIRALADVQTPQPVAAVVRTPPPVALDSLTWSRLVVADGLQDPGNLGSLIRTAHAAGFDALALTEGTADPFNPKAVRASAGSCFALPIVRTEPDALPRDAHLWVADAKGEEDYRRVRFRLPLVFVFGSEGRGPAHTWARARRVRIPIRPGSESLNVTAAAAVLLFTATDVDARGAGVYGPEDRLLYYGHRLDRS
ncbi:MAG: RNA methyltransferase [Armatimonadota bacterium]|nr:RNA methyltransferase [Armatimonadota bacterium]MDR5697610.1 RNA methyltransferase [Armatimonadota bacterium]